MAALAGAKTFLATARTNLGGPRRSWQSPKQSWLQTRRFAGRQDKGHGDSSYPPRVAGTASSRKDGTETAPTRNSPGRRQDILGGRNDKFAADETVLAVAKTILAANGKCRRQLIPAKWLGDGSILRGCWLLPPPLQDGLVDALYEVLAPRNMGEEGNSGGGKTALARGRGGNTGLCPGAASCHPPGWRRSRCPSAVGLSALGGLPHL